MRYNTSTFNRLSTVSRPQLVKFKNDQGKISVNHPFQALSIIDELVYAQNESDTRIEYYNPTNWTRSIRKG